MKAAIDHYEAALKEAFPGGATGDVFHHWNEARKALEQPAIPQGWKLVPVEPTEEMQDAGVPHIPTENCHPYDAGQVYLAMLSAAPTPQGE